MDRPPSKELSLDSKGISFNQLCDPEHTYPIQVDTPEPLHSSPRQSINPRAVLLNGSPSYRPGGEVQKVWPVYPLMYFGSEETVNLSQAPSSSDVAGDEVCPPSSMPGRSQPLIEVTKLAPFYYFKPDHDEKEAPHIPEMRGWFPGVQQAQVAVQSAHLEHITERFERSPAKNRKKAVTARPKKEIKGPLEPKTSIPEDDSEATKTPLRETKSLEANCSPSVVHSGLKKRKRGRPRKNPILEGTTPTQLPQASKSKPARGFHTPKTPKTAVQYSPTPLRKSRGCWTCKCRRKKCDEAYPSCTSCAKLDFPCLGYSMERPECMSTPEKSESTRLLFTSYTKEKKEFMKRVKAGNNSPLASPFPKINFHNLVATANDENSEV